LTNPRETPPDANTNTAKAVDTTGLLLTDGLDK